VRHTGGRRFGQQLTRNMGLVWDDGTDDDNDDDPETNLLLDVGGLVPFRTAGFLEADTGRLFTRLTTGLVESSGDTNSSSLSAADVVKAMSLDTPHALDHDIFTFDNDGCNARAKDDVTFSAILSLSIT
jgi:hypothetical protein